MLVPPTFTPEEIKIQKNAKARELAVVQGLAAEIKNIFGPPPVLSSEDPKAFDRLLFALVRARCPSDFILKMCVWDIAVGTWHMSRIERVMKQTLDTKVRQLLKLQKDRLERQVQQKAERMAAAKSEAAATADLTPDEKRNDWMRERKSRLNASRLRTPAAALPHGPARPATTDLAAQRPARLRTLGARPCRPGSCPLPGGTWRIGWRPRTNSRPILRRPAA